MTLMNTTTALVGRALGFLVGGVRRVTFRLHADGDPGRAQLTIERRDQVAGYRLVGSWLRWPAPRPVRVAVPAAVRPRVRGRP